MTATGFGHAKVILLGEHAVVYGMPAIVAALDIGVEVEARRGESDRALTLLDEAGATIAVAGSDSELGRALQAIVDGLPEPYEGSTLTVSSTVPARVGLGSSAALAVAIVRSLASLSGLHPSDADVAQLANRAEAVFHGNPSGVDVAAASYGSLLFFRKDQAPRAIVASAPFELILALIEPAPSTRDMVDHVRRCIERGGQTGRAHLAAIEGLVHDAALALERGDLPLLGQHIDANHEHLQAIGASTPRIDAACLAARQAGAAGAKLTGAGGGGMVLALAPGRERDVRRAFEELGATDVRVVRVVGTASRT